VCPYITGEALRNFSSLIEVRNIEFGSLTLFFLQHMSLEVVNGTADLVKYDTG